MVSNPNFYGQSTTGTPNQIEDGVDFPHTGIVKALSDGLGQNYAISGFDITIDSATQIDVGAGVIFRDGKRVAVSAVSNLTLSSTYTNGYHLLIASSASSPVLTIRNPTAADKVPEYTAGDTIIAVITHNGTANVGIQYLTVNKTENSLSLGYDNSGYTETGTLTADANGITMTGLYKLDTLPDATATIAGADKILLQDSDDSDKIKTATASSIAALAPQGDITSVVAGSALTGGGTTGDVTLNVIGGDGITANADELEVAVDDSTIELSNTDGSGQVRIKDLGVSTGKIADDAVTYAKIQNVSQTNVVLGRDNTGAGIIQEIGATALGTMIGDTLDTVTGRGGTTGNNITVGAATITTRLFASKAGSLDANPDTIVQYVDASQNTTPNQYTLPPATTYDGVVFIIKNLNPSANMTVVPQGADVFEDNVASIDARYTTATQLTLKPLQSVMLQAVTDSLSIPLAPLKPLASGWMILETDTGGSSGIANVVDDTTPQLGGDLDVNGNKITGSIVFDGDVDIETGHTFKNTRLETSTISVATALTEANHSGKYIIASADLTLPSPNVGEHYYILNNSGSSISIIRDDSADTINGATSDVTLTSYKGATCIGVSSTAWIVLGV